MLKDIVKCNGNTATAHCGGILSYGDGGAVTDDVVTCDDDVTDDVVLLMGVLPHARQTATQSIDVVVGAVL